MGGNDTLKGGAGQDRFVFAETGPGNQDTMAGFSHADDAIGLTDMLDGAPDSVVRGLTFPANVLSAAQYFEGPGFTGNGAESRGMFNDKTTGTISYNPTAGFAGDYVVICTVGVVKAASLDHTDFVFSS